MGRSWWPRYGVDLAIALALAVVAFLLRRHGLPTDGLWLDDSITGAGLTASPSDLFTVSADHPGFTVTLMVWRELTGGSDAALTYLALAAGTLAPAFLYLGLRWCGYEHSIGVLLAAALAVAETDVIYSGRVRTYTVDVLIVLAVALAIPRLTRIRWSWRTGLPWIVVAALLAFWSGFALIAVGVAGAIIVLHPAADLRLRGVAVGIQEAICVALLVVEGNTHSLPAQEDNFRRTWDAFPDFSLNPIHFARETFVHFRRVGEYFVGGPDWFGGLCIVVAIVGLGFAAWRGRETVRARYLLLLVLTTFVAGLLGKFPFGPAQGVLGASGGRVSLWLIPAVAIGLAVSIQAIRGRLAGRRQLAFAFDAVAFVAAAAVLVVGLARDPVAYPFPGARSATEFVQSHLGPRDALLIAYRSNWSFATESRFPSDVQPTPESSIGFQPEYPDPRVHYLDISVDSSQVAPKVAHADRVFVYYMGPPFSESEAQLRPRLAASLSSLGFTPQSTPSFQYATVQLWTRGGRGAGTGNLTISDLPSGWALAAPASPPVGTRALTCLDLSQIAGSTSAFAANGPSGENLFSQVDRWASAAAASQAVAAYGAPSGARCVESALEQSLAAAGLPLKLTATREAPPRAAGPEAAMYRLSAVNQGTGAPAAQGAAVISSRGPTTAQLIALHAGAEPVSESFVSRLTATLARRLTATSP
jgi:hypothetical protein